MKKKYEASTAENHVDIVNIAGLEARVKDHMSNEKGAFGYIRGGSEDEWTMDQNTKAFILIVGRLSQEYFKELIMLI